VVFRNAGAAFPALRVAMPDKDIDYLFLTRNAAQTG
jgi:hypothetical protein